MVEYSPNIHEVLGSVPGTTLPDWKFLLETPMSTIFTRTALFSGLVSGNAKKKKKKKRWALSGSSH